MNKLSIKPIINGPLKLIKLSTQNLENILFYDNKPITIEKNLLLCRCGKSNKQPYCDGTHNKIFFNSQNNLKDEIIQVYKTENITVNFNRSICSGAANCVNKFPKIYTPESENWIHPHMGNKEQIIESIKNCPSGALSYSLGDKKNLNACILESCNKQRISILKNSCIQIRGPIDLQIDKWSTNANKTKYTLCRCGNSLNKPFCDYSHASLDDESYSF